MPAEIKQNKPALIECSLEEIKAIVQPIVEMSLLVASLGSATRLKTFEAKAVALHEGKRQLARLLEKAHGRPFWPERFSGMSVSTHPRSGGAFDLVFNETTPSKEGNSTTVLKARLIASGEPVQTRFVKFVQGNNPTQRSELYEMADQVIQASGI